MTKFKVGDKVKRKPSLIYAPFGDGIYTVIFVDSGGNIKVELPAVDKCSGPWMSEFFDLAEEIKPTPKAGEYWKQRDGTIVGPLEVHERSALLRHGGNLNIDLYWYSTGFFDLQNDSPYDLIEKVEYWQFSKCCGKIL